MTFQKAWGMLRQAKPELFDEDRPLATTGQAHPSLSRSPEFSSQPEKWWTAKASTIHAERAQSEEVVVESGFFTDLRAGSVRGRSRARP
jgi:hypothetical protein